MTQHNTIQVTARVIADVPVDSTTPAKDAVREAMNIFTREVRAKEVEFYDFDCLDWNSA